MICLSSVHTALDCAVHTYMSLVGEVFVSFIPNGLGTVFVLRLPVPLLQIFIILHFTIFPFATLFVTTFFICLPAVLVFCCCFLYPSYGGSFAFRDQFALIFLLV